MRIVKSLLALAAIALTLYGSWSLVSDVSNTEDEAFANCETDLKFREEYQRRARLEKRLFHLEAQTNRISNRILALTIPDDLEDKIPFLREAREHFARTAQLEDRLGESISILPLRDCG